MSETISTDIVVIYHGQCRDGLSAAYAAWKKFGDRATYLPRTNQTPPPEGLSNKEIYILDYSYPKEDLDTLAAHNKSVVVIDHHQSARDAVTAFPQNRFDESHSGAMLSWTYFHPDTPPPRLFRYIEEHDLWKSTLPHSGEIAAAIGQYPLAFDAWDELMKLGEGETSFATLVAEGAVLRTYIDRHVAELASFAEPVSFEGHHVYAVNCARPFRSAVGNLLATQHPPFAIVWYRYDGTFHLSLRSIGDFDVAALAEKYGGGGHRNAASAQFTSLSDLPFQFLS